MSELELEERVRQHMSCLQPLAKSVAASTNFGLNLPCALLTETEVIGTSLSGLRGHLPCSVALASPAIERFMTLKERVGFEQAFSECSSDNEDGQEFCRAWDESQEDLASGVLVTLNDLVAMVEQAKEGWGKSPRQLLVVGVSSSVITSGLVPTDWLTR